MLASLWSQVDAHPEAVLKRQLWAELLEKVYGSRVTDDELFLQHTYLTIVAKTMATRVLGIELPSPSDLLSGAPFEQAQIEGAVESDFFDWVLLAPSGAELVSRIAHQTARFKLEAVETDVLKSLYESLIDPEQRHDLGEYYTPDWLAYRMCEQVITNPLEQRVLDPSCGSGTFVFQAIRRLLAFADNASLSNQDALALCTTKVLGVDIHPVAVIIARITYLLALGSKRLQSHPPLSIPVYLGDSLQWNTEHFMAEREVLVEVPEGPVLHFPASVAQSPAVFDAIVQAMSDMSERDYEREAFVSWLQREYPLAEPEERAVADTFERLRGLYREGRNHIWGYVVRNLSRPVWLSSSGQRADVVIGNPPWLSFRYMSREMQSRFRKECTDRNIWAGGNVATQQDLSGYFFARAVELYLDLNGIIAFVMPNGALNRKQFTGFREGRFGRRTQSTNPFATVRFVEAWDLDAVKPLFPNTACVLIARPAEPGRLPLTVRKAIGGLLNRDASPEEAEARLEWVEVPWPSEIEFSGGSPYREAFHDGATIYPRVLTIVERVPGGMLGENREAPLLESRRSSQEKQPWQGLPSMRGNVEAQFVRELYLGESIAPYRLLSPALAIIPWDADNGVLSSSKARNLGYRHLADWLSNAEQAWNHFGRSRVALDGQLDYLHKLSAQFPLANLRVLYSKAGTLPAAVLLRNSDGAIDHTLYWMPVIGETEGLFLVAILNSDEVRRRVEKQQARGQWGARHFDKLMFGLPIPKFDDANSLHQRLAELAREAESIAASVLVNPGTYFQTARRNIREALTDKGISQEVDARVAELLGP